MMGIVKVKIAALSIAAVLVLAIIPLAVVSALAPGGSAPPTPATTPAPAPAATLPAMPKADEAALKDPRWWLQQATAATEQIPDPQRRWWQDIDLVQTYARLGDVATAIRLGQAAAALPHHEESGRSGSSVPAAVAAAQAKAGDLPAARATIAAAQASFAPDPELSERLDRLAQSIGLEGHAALAIEVADSVPDPARRSFALTSAARYQRLLGDREGAGRTRQAALKAAALARAKELNGAPAGAKSDGLADGAYWTILCECGFAGDVAGAKMAAKGYSRPSKAQGWVLDAMLAGGDVAGARAWAQEAKPTERVGAQASIVKVLLSRGDRQAAAILAQSMEKTAGELQEPAKRIQAYMDVARAAGRLRDLQQLTLATAKIEADIAALRDIDSGYEQLATVQAAAGDIAAAARSAAAIDPTAADGYILMRALLRVAEAQIRAGQLAEAHQGIDKLPQLLHRTIFAREVGFRQALRGDLENARTWASGRPAAERAALCTGVANGLLPRGLNEDED